MRSAKTPGDRAAVKHRDLISVGTETDPLLPIQFFPAASGRNFATGEMRLLCALLIDAIQCFQSYSASESIEGRDLYLKAAAWIRSREEESPFSFESVCGYLGIDPEALRQSLQRKAQASAADGRAAKRLFRRTHIFTHRPHGVSEPRVRRRAGRKSGHGNELTNGSVKR